MPAEIILNLAGNAEEKFRTLDQAANGVKESLDKVRSSLEQSGNSTKDATDAQLRLAAAMERDDIAAKQNGVSLSQLNAAYAQYASASKNVATEITGATAKTETFTVRLTDQAAKVQLLNEAWKNMTETQRQTANQLTLTSNKFKVLTEAQMQGSTAWATTTSWMKKNHENAAHYMAMMDRMTGLHTGLANVLMTGFIPSLLGIGIALSAVAFAVKHWQEAEKDLNKQVEDAEKIILKKADAIEKLNLSHAALNPQQREFIELAKQIKAQQLAEEHEKHAKALSHLTGITMYWKLGIASIVEVVAIQKEAVDSVVGSIFGFQKKTEEATMSITEQAKGLKELSEKYNHQIPFLDRFADVLGKIGLKVDKLTISEHDLGKQSEERDRILKKLNETQEKAYDIVNKITKAERDNADAVNALAIAYKKGEINIIQFHQALANQAIIANAKTETSHKSHIAKKKDAEDLYTQYRLQSEQELADKLKAIHDKGLSDNTARINRQMAAQLSFYDQTTKMEIAAVADKKKRAEAELAYQIMLVNRLTAAEVGGETQRDRRIQALHAAHNAAMDKMDESALKKDLVRDKKRLSSYQSSVMGMVNATGQGQSKIGRIMTGAFQIFEELENLKTMMVTMQEAKKQTTVAAGLVSGVTTKAAESTAKIGMDGATAATGSYSAMASIPYVGPMLGIAAALAAIIYGQQQASKAKEAASSFSGQAHEGMRVPESGSYLMNLQSGESILPNNNGLMDISSSISSLDQSLKRNGAGGGGGGQHIHIHAGTVVGDQQTSVKLAKMVKRAMRYGNV